MCARARRWGKEADEIPTISIAPIHPILGPEHMIRETGSPYKQVTQGQREQAAQLPFDDGEGCGGDTVETGR